MYVNFDDENLADIQVSELNDIVEMLYRIYGDFTHPFIAAGDHHKEGYLQALQSALSVMYGETGIIEHDGKNIRVVNAADWLLPSCVVPLHAENLSDSSKIDQKNEVLDKIYGRISSKITKKNEVLDKFTCAHMMIFVLLRRILMQKNYGNHWQEQRKTTVGSVV